MAKQVVKNYTFDHTAKTVTLTDFTTVLLSRLALITDVTTNTILYNFADPTVSAATVAGNVITLASLPGGTADSDKLRIDYDGLPADPSVDANILAGDVGQNALLIAGSRKEVSFTTTTAANLASTDVSNYGFVSVHMTSQGGSSVVTFQVSNDNVNWLTVQLQQTQFGTIGTSTSAVDFYTGPIPARYFRLAVTGIASGTTAGVVEFFSAPRSPQLAPFVGQQVAGVASSGAALKNGPVRIGGAFHTSQPSVTDGQTVDAQATARGALIVATGIDALVAQLSDGTMTASVTAGDSGQNALIVSSARKEVSFTTTTVQTLAATDVSNFRSVSVQIVTQGTGSSVGFQGSNDNVNWNNIPLQFAGASTVPGVVSTTAVLTILTGPLNCRYFRLTITGISSGTTAGVIEFSSLPATWSQNFTELTDTSGNIVGVIAGDSGQNALVVSSARKEVSFTTTTVQAVASTDVSNYRSVSVHVVTQGGSSTVTFQCSNDNANWLTCPLQLSSNATNAASTSTTSASQMWYGALPARYFRLNVTGIASGTTAGVVEFSSAPVTLTTLGVAAVGASTNGSAIPGSSLVVAGVARTASPTALATGQVSPLMTDTLGKAVVAPYANPENIINGVSISITGTASTQVIAAQAASVRSYITSISVVNASATVGTQVNILDGATVIDTVFVGPTTQANCSEQLVYPVPQRGTAATAVNAQCVTTGAAVTVVAHGYTAP